MGKEGPQLVGEQKGKKNPWLNSRGRTFNTVNRGLQAFLALPLFLPDSVPTGQVRFGRAGRR